MLQYIKKYIKGWLLGIILFFISISFAFWGVGDIFRSNPDNYLAKVGKKKISRDHFVTEFQLQVDSYNSKNKTTTENDIREIANQTLSNLTNRHLFLNMSDEMKLKVSKDVLKRKIMNNELFFSDYTGEKKFNSNIYKTFVSRRFGSEENYLNYLENQILIETLVSHFDNLNSYPNNLSKIIYNHIQQQRSFEIASIDKIYEQRMIKEPDKNILKTFYEKNKTDFNFDERRSFSYIYLNPEILGKDIEINKKEIEEVYNNRIDEFLEPEKRNVEQIILNNENDAKKIIDYLKNNNTFEGAVKSNADLNLEIIKLGILEKKQLLTEFADDVFLLNVDQHTEAIKTDIGWHVLRVKEIIKAKNKPINLVEDIIKKDIIEERAYDDMEIIIAEIEDELIKENSLEDIGNKLNIKLEQKKLMEKKDFSLNKDLPEIFSNEKFYNDVFGKDINDDLFIEEVDDGFFVLRVDEIINKKQKEFKEAYNDVFILWSKMESKKEINKKITQFKENLRKGNFFKASDMLKMDSRSTDFVNREALIEQGFSEIFVDKLFKADKKEILEENTDQIYYFVKVISDKEKIFDENEYQEVKYSINQTFGYDNLEQLGNILKKKYPIKVNMKLFNTFIKNAQ